MADNVLLIAYHYPPIRGSSGLHRTLAFSKYLPECGWHPTVLTVHPRAYRDRSEDLLDESIPTIRAFALDASRHLSIKGRYLRATSLPDAWSSWLVSGVIHGLRYCRRHKPKVIWATCPIPTALYIGYVLHRLTGIPWVADFRDPLVEEDDPMIFDEWQRRSHIWIERRAVETTALTFFAAPSAVDLYRRRYPMLDPEKFVCLENGYDESAFECITREWKSLTGPVTLLHSGIVYPYARDPTALFTAISDLKSSGQLDPTSLKVVLRATGHDQLLEQMISEYDIADLVQLAPAIEYGQALHEMVNTDALLVMQASNSNYQIPAKIYEYLRADRPILGLTDPQGDTGRLLNDAGCPHVVRLDSATDIKAALPEFLQGVRDDRLRGADRDYTLNCDRRQRAHQLANYFATL